jgi:BirA family biotin operon repressor/biotin-[acetyl-CoA-carboxylase] ligase
MKLPPEIEAAGYRLTHIPETGSTNDDAAAAARAGDPGRRWFIADVQTAGRGRQGRAWASPPGNLHASLLLVEPCDPAVAPQLGFVAGVALHDAVAGVTGFRPPRLALKWPNDLLLDGMKVSGLLLEGHRIGPEGVFTVVIGFGVNVADGLEDAPYGTRALRTVSPSLTREALFGHLAATFAERLATWQNLQAGGSVDPFAPVRQDWLARASGLGGPVTARLASGQRHGTFKGLDRFGRLELQTASGLERIDAADIYLLAPTALVPALGPAR